MNNKRCPSCGFINFASAAACRKCQTSLDSAVNSVQSGWQTPGSSYGSGYQYRPPRKRRIPLWIKLSAAGATLIVASFIAIVVVAVLFVKSHSKVVWQEFRPGEPGLSVMMPGEPTVHEPIIDSTGIGEVKKYMYTSKVIGQGQVMFLVVSFPVNFDRDKYPLDKALDGELDNVLTAANATLVSKSSFDEGELKGRSFEFKPQGVIGADTGAGKLYLAGNRLYVLTVLARKNSELYRSREKFLKPTIPYF